MFVLCYVWSFGVLGSLNCMRNICDCTKAVRIFDLMMTYSKKVLVWQKKRLVHRMCYDGVSARMNLVFSSLLAFHSFACVSILWTAERIEVNNEINFYSIIHWREIKFWIIFSVESFFFVIVALATVGCLYVFVFVVLWIKTMERTESQCHLDI